MEGKGVGKPHPDDATDKAHWGRGSMGRTEAWAGPRERRVTILLAEDTILGIDVHHHSDPAIDALGADARLANMGILIAPLDLSTHVGTPGWSDFCVYSTSAYNGWEKLTLAARQALILGRLQRRCGTVVSMSRWAAGRKVPWHHGGSSGILDSTPGASELTFTTESILPPMDMGELEASLAVLSARRPSWEARSAASLGGEPAPTTPVRRPSKRPRQGKSPDVDDDEPPSARTRRGNGKEKAPMASHS